MSKKKPEGFESSYSDDGHYLIDGARWHYPKTGEPTVCAVAGCERVLGQQKRGFDLDELPDAPEGADNQDAPEAVMASDEAAA